jgi:hypothetical protein
MRASSRRQEHCSIDDDVESGFIPYERIVFTKKISSFLKWNLNLS